MRRERGLLSLLLLVLVSMALAVGTALVYTNQAVRDSDRRWCEILTELDRAYASAPPASETGRRVAAAIHRLRVDVGCP